MFNAIFEMLSYSFILRAFVVGALVALCSSLLGVSLVLKRYSMIGDGLSHVGFGALAFATVFNLAPMYVAVPVVALAAIILLRLSESSKIKGDAATSLISAGSLAIGIMAISLKKGVNIDLNSYMFGSILSVTKSETVFSIIFAIIITFIYILFYNKIFAVTFDETFTRSTGANAGAYNLILAVLTAVTTVLGMKVMGTLLISSLIIFPPLSAMRLCHRFKSVVICSAAVSLVCFFVGLTSSFFLQTPAGASVVVTNIAAFAAFWLIDVLNKKIKKPV